MTEYSKCGHTTNGVIILDDNIMSMSAYLEWSETVGVFGDKTKCWECYCKEIDERLNKDSNYDGCIIIICKGCGKECQWDDDGLCEECGKKTYDELEIE